MVDDKLTKQTPTALVRLQAIHPQLGQSIPYPQRMTEQAAGFDLAAAIDAPITLEPMQRALVACGFSMALPFGYEAQIRPRSGLAWRHGVTCLNAPGTIDADYRGEVAVLLVNLGDQAFVVQPGMRIAQMVIAQVPQVNFVAVDMLQETARDRGGFGSTGT